MLSVPYALKKGKQLSRKDIEDFTKYVGLFGAKGLAWMRVTEAGLESNIVKFFPESSKQALLQITAATADDLLLFVADEPAVVFPALGHLRLEIAKTLNLIEENKFNFLWVHDFPLFEYDKKEGRYYSVHHPFTMPSERDLDKLEKDPGTVTSQAYDLVLNGTELGGGSVRIHDSQIQNKVFSILGLQAKEVQEKFGFFVRSPAVRAPTPWRHRFWLR